MEPRLTRLPQRGEMFVVPIFCHNPTSVLHGLTESCRHLSEACHATPALCRGHSPYSRVEFLSAFRFPMSDFALPLRPSATAGGFSECIVASCGNPFFSIGGYFTSDVFPALGSDASFVPT